jgi:hypothetical protein
VYKKLVIFDIDSSLNIYLIFLRDADVGRENGITQQRINIILNQNRPVEKYKAEQMMLENKENFREEDPLL